MENFEDYKYVIKVSFPDRVMYYNGGNYCIVANPYLASRYLTTEDKKGNIDYVKSNVEAAVEFALYEVEYKAYLEAAKKLESQYD